MSATVEIGKRAASVLNVTAWRIGIASSIPVAWIGATAVICAALGGGLVCCGSFVMSAITIVLSGIAIEGVLPLDQMGFLW